MRRGRIPIGRIIGVPISLHVSWIFIFILAWIALGGKFYPDNFPHWPAWLSWAAGLVITVLFFATVLGHELAHALVARWRGVRVRGITLTFLGGAAEIEQDSDRPSDELLISAAGPLSSFGFAALFFGVQVGTLALGQVLPRGGDLLPAVGAGAGYLAMINLWLAAFNSIPGFPLDGGRVLRGFIWMATGNFVTATRAAVTVGRVVAGLLVLYGLWSTSQGHSEDLWYLFVGWFLNSTALQSGRQVRLQGVLRELPVWRLMRQDFAWVQAATSVQELAQHYAGDRSQPGLPVLDGDQFVGLITWGDVQKVPEVERAVTRVGAAMTPLPRLATIDAEAHADALLRVFQQSEATQVPVLRLGHLVGLVTQSDLARALESRR